MQGPISFSATARRQVEARRLPASIVLLPALGALLLGILVYQLPTRNTVEIGSLGDQLFLDSSEALDATPDLAGQWYVDELGMDGRSRWTRSRARITFPRAGRGDTELALRVQGWPEDVTRSEPRQPVVTVRVGASPDGIVVGQLTPTSGWQDYRFSIPAEARRSSDLPVELEVSETFTTTRQYADVRPKGVRVDSIGVAISRPAGLGAPSWTGLGYFAGAVLLLTLAARRGTGGNGLAVVFGTALAVAGATALTVLRPWFADALPALFGVSAVALGLAQWERLFGIGRAALARTRSGRGLSLAGIVALAAVGLLVAANLVARAGLPSPASLAADSDRLIQLLPMAVLAGVLVVAGPTVLPEALRSLRERLLAGRLTPVLLLGAGAIVLGWELQLLRELPFVGHADYADNAVVARSLLRGEGWTVPYVTQFYWLVPRGSVYRPQETWPLLQPVWMAPWMALLGSTAFAARISNLVFNLLLLLLVYHIGSSIWDRRVGALAAVLTLLNYYFFLLTVYSTTDLGFTILSMAALWAFFQAVERERGPWPRTAEAVGERARRRWVLRWGVAGVLAGLMVLQKPTGALFGAGMLAWLLLRWWAGRRTHEAARPTGLARVVAGLPWRGVLLWGGLAALVVLPYVVRNLLLWGRPVFSTESYDAWILGYKGTRDEAWEEIYRIYLGNLPNRSWILQWGWDRTFNKLLTQLSAVRAYLLPGDPGLPDRTLTGVAATWLALLGLLTLRGRQLALMALVGLVAGGYTLFLVTYWHANEHRYFVPFIPWLLLLAMAALCAAFDRVLRFGGGRWAGLAGGLAVLLLWAILQPQLSAMDAYLDPKSGRYWGRSWAPDLEAYAWLQEHTRPDEVVMTRVPWQLSWTADRPSVMIPNAPLASDDPRVRTIMQVARYYGADYLVVNAMGNPGPEASDSLRELREGRPILGFTPVYTGEPRFGRKPVYIYRFPADYAGAAPLQP